MDSEVLDPVGACSHQNEYLEKPLLEDVSVASEPFHRVILLDHREKNRSKKQNIPRENTEPHAQIRVHEMELRTTNIELLNIVLEKVDIHLVLILEVELLVRVTKGEHPKRMMPQNHIVMGILNDSPVQIDRKILVRMKRGRSNHVQKTHSELRKKNMDHRRRDPRRNFTHRVQILVHEMELLGILEKEDILLALTQTLGLLVRMGNFIHHVPIRARDFHAQVMRVGHHAQNRENVDDLALPCRSLAHPLEQERTGKTILQSQRPIPQKRFQEKNMYQRDFQKNRKMIDKS